MSTDLSTINVQLGSAAAIRTSASAGGGGSSPAGKTKDADVKSEQQQPGLDVAAANEFFQEIPHLLENMQESQRDQIVRAMNLVDTYATQTHGELESIKAYLSYMDESQERIRLEQQHQMRQEFAVFGERLAAIQAALEASMAAKTPPPSLKLSQLPANVRRAVNQVFAAQNTDLRAGLQQCLELTSDVAAATVAAVCFLYGVGSVRNPTKALQVLNGHESDPRAQALLAECYLTRPEHEQHYALGVKLFESASAARDHYATLLEGDFYLRKDGAVFMYDKAIGRQKYEEIRTMQSDRFDASLLKSLAEMRLAAFLRQDGKVNEALAMLRDAAENHPNVLTKFEYGKCLLEVGGNEHVAEARSLIQDAADCKLVAACKVMYQNYCADKPADVLNLEFSPDGSLAIKYAMLAAEQGDADAQLFLGDAYRNGAYVVQSNEDAYKWFLAAAETGSAKAQYIVGLMHRDGIGTRQSFGDAHHYFWLAAEQDHADAQFELGRSYELGLHDTTADPRRAVEWYTKAVAQNHPAAQYRLSECYWAGSGVEMDRHRAKELLFAAAEGGHLDAMYKYGLMLGENCRADLFDLPFSWVLTAARRGHAMSKFIVAECEKRLGIQQNAKEAFELAKAAADGGCLYGTAELGTFYERGLVANRDINMALKLYSQSAEAGKPNGQYFLGRLYANGVGVSQNILLAFYWYDKAASVGFEDAIAALDKLNDGEIESCELITTIVERLEELGTSSKVASYLLGRCHAEGVYYAMDSVMAFQWYQQSASLGHPDGQRRLADCYVNSWGTPPSAAHARHWYWVAAANGSVEARNALKLFPGVDPDALAPTKSDDAKAACEFQKFKLVLVGSQGVGKSAILSHLSGLQDSGSHRGCKTLDYCVFEIPDKAQLNLFDSRGDTPPSVLRKLCRKCGTDAVVFVYDVTNMESFESFKAKFKPMIPDTVPCFIVANKVDLMSQRVVTTQMGEQLAESCGAYYFECNGNVRSGVESIIYTLAEQLLFNKSEELAKKGKPRCIFKTCTWWPFNKISK